MKKTNRSFKIKLWEYFLIFTAIIFCALWLLQTVFIQNFYNSMLISDTKKAAEKIAESCRKNGYTETIDHLTHENSLLVFITDTSGNMIYSADGFSIFHSDERGGKIKGRNGRKIMGGVYRILPENFGGFLEMLSESDDGSIEFTDDDLYIYGTYIEPADGEKAVLYVSTILDPVGSAASIIRRQLLWVTLLSVLIAAVISWITARSFSKPVAELTEKARRLGEQDYPKDLKTDFCKELDELSDTLDKTSEKLAASETFRNELMANVSHDLRTPLTMIKGYAEMVRDISRTDEEQCNEDIAVIVRETDRLTALVNEILEYSELQMSDHEVISEDVDLTALVNRTADSFETYYRHEDMIFERNIAENVIVKGNAGRLERAVYNLIDNAVRHTGESRRVKISLCRENSSARIDVEDFGNGIPESELEAVWDRYYTSRQRKGKGVSGLGLSIVKQIVSMHGGSCGVKSIQGEGSDFTIILNAENI